MVAEISSRLFHLGASPIKSTPDGLLHNPLLTNAWLGTLICYLLVPAPRLERALVLVVGGLAEAWLWSLRAAFEGPYGRLLSLGAGLGLAAVAALAMRVAVSRGEARRDAWALLAIGLLDPLALSFGSWPMSLTASRSFYTFDTHCYVVDYCLGFCPSARVLSFLMVHHALYNLALGVYCFLPVWLITSRLLAFRHPHLRYNDVQLGFICIALVGSVLYNLVPTAGTGIFAGFPVHPPPPMPPILVPVDVAVPRNAMPSLHCAWIVAVFWCARGFGRVAAWVGFIILAITLVSTSISNHYAVDLVAGVPLALLCQSLSTRPQSANRALRLQCIGFGLIALLGWELLIRQVPLFLYHNPGVVVGLAAAIVSGSIWLESRLRAVSLGLLSTSREAVAVLAASASALPG